MGFALPPALPKERCALTAPFHPCLQPEGRAGGLFSVALSLGSPPPAVSRHRSPVEPGLSSITTVLTGATAIARPSDGRNLTQQGRWVKRGTALFDNFPVPLATDRPRGRTSPPFSGKLHHPPDEGDVVPVSFPERVCRGWDASCDPHAAQSFRERGDRKGCIPVSATCCE